MAACEEAENNTEDAINCLDIDFPITILTYSLNLEQTGSVVVNSEQELYTYMNNFNNDELFAVNYPITASLNGQTNSVVEISSDMDLQNKIDECLTNDNLKDDAENNSENLETILVEGAFKVQSLVSSGIDKTNEFAEFTIDFANDLNCTATNIVNSTISDVEGTYEVASEMHVFLSFHFTGSTTFELLNSTWKVTSYSENSIELQSTTNAALTLVLTQI